MAKLLSALALLLLCAGVAQAAPFFDPTRPLAGVPGTDQASAEPAREPALVLQSVLRSAQRQVAIINGVQVIPGGQIGAWRLLRLGNRHAELQGAQGKLTLWLLPANGHGTGDRKVTPASLTLPSTGSEPALDLIGGQVKPSPQMGEGKVEKSLRDFHSIDSLNANAKPQASTSPGERKQ